MAKYEDYAARYNQTEQEEAAPVAAPDVAPATLEGEIEQAGAAATERNSEIPASVYDRFDGKSQEDVYKAFANLEAEKSRLGNLVGSQRQALDQMVLQTVESTTEAEVPETVPVSSDDLYDDPDAAIRRVASEVSGERVAKLEQALLEQREATKRAAFEARNPDYRQTIADPAFAEYIKGSEFRVKLAVRADAGDYDAAEELFGLYGDLQAAAKTATTTATRSQQLRDATLESASPATGEVDEVIKRSDIIDLKFRAKSGDREAQVALAANGEKIRRAYAEGRVVD